MRSLRLSAAALFVTVSAFGDATVSPAVLEQLAAGKTARVIVAFDESHVALKSDIRDFAVTQRWRNVSAVAGEMSIATLSQLAANPAVRAISLDEPMFVTAKESVPLIGGEAVRARGFNGAGVPAADEGKHGTTVAGIIGAAGILASPGVAPASKLVAIRVTDRGGNWAYTSQVISALDYLISHRRDVRAVNISLSNATEYTTACDSASADARAIATAVAKLRNRGTAVFVASGNNGWANGVPLPACISGVTTVGAVYDASSGPSAFNMPSGSCLDAATHADQIACFSNSGSLVDLLAPGARIVSAMAGGGLASGSGTSFAAPHAAGAAAILFSLKPALSVDQLEALLRATGTVIADPRSGVATPRINVDRAVEELLRGSRRRRAALH